MSRDAATRYGIFNVLGWTAAYLAVCGIVPVLLGFTMEASGLSADTVNAVDLFAQILCNTTYFSILLKSTGLRISLTSGLTAGNLLLAVGASLFFFTVCDLLLDPLFARMFPSSETEYLQAVAQFRSTPIITGIQVCLVAPIVEELLMRGIILPTVSSRYGRVSGLAVSTFLFAFLHFNFLQTISAVLCGLVLGMLMFKTKSLLCCILAHALYNGISYLGILFPCEIP